MSDDYSKMIAPRADEELHDGVEASPLMKPSETDGLPIPVAQTIVDAPPGLSLDNLICMADTRSFVIRDRYGDISETIDQDKEPVRRSGNGSYYVLRQSTWVASAKNPTPPAEPPVYSRPVEPIRPQCKHYLRQMTDLTADRDGRFIQRSCLAQRSETGEYVSLRDSALFACSIREPRHLESEALLDAFDAGLLSLQESKRSMEDFDVDSELAREGASLGVLGRK